MPTYEYLCMDCGNRKEVVQSFMDAPLTTCEVCGGKLRKVIHPVGIQFKGSGFYSTDRRASQPVSRSNNNEKDSSKADSASDSKSESKSETKGETKSDSSIKSDSESTTTRKTAEKSA